MCSLTDIFTNIVHIGRDELRMSRQAIYVRQWSRHAQFEFTDDRFSHDADYNATQQYILDINGLSITLTGNAGKQSKYTKYSGSEKQKFYEK